MTDEQIVKKKRVQKPVSKNTGRNRRTSTFPTLARIVSSNGSLVAEIPRLTINISQLTIYDHLRIALEHAALAISCLSRLGSRVTPALADSHNLAPTRLNLEDLMNHLYFAIEGWDKSKERS